MYLGWQEGGAGAGADGASMGVTEEVIEGEAVDSRATHLTNSERKCITILWWN